MERTWFTGFPTYPNQSRPRAWQMALSKSRGEPALQSRTRSASKLLRRAASVCAKLSPLPHESLRRRFFWLEPQANHSRLGGLEVPFP